jgi:hypothetical protein
MRQSRRVATVLLALASVASAASIGLSVRQAHAQRSAVDVVIDSASVGQLNGLASAITGLPGAQQAAIARRHGFSSPAALTEALASQRGELDRAQQVRDRDLISTDRALLMSIGIALFSALAASFGAISLYEADRVGTAAGRSAASVEYLAR